ncbi:MAG: TetR/AcrR family transcriptional regulator [Propionibacteriaceae bacterium]|nr:TetR/AcrR family transcriptional regulator [Propionibacteriaceae bacterium]
MEFQRARSEEQREQRRRVILDTAASMLAEMPVAAISLNELSRRVGLAKSNVLRYFESREAVLLELLNTEFDQWIRQLRQRVPSGAGSTRERGDGLAEALATTMAERPVLCDLISAQAAVLERNISTEVALRFKGAIGQSADQVTSIVAGALPELGPDEAYHVVVVALMIVSAAWPHSQPTAALQAAYDADPRIAAGQLDFTDFVGTTIAITISGLLARHGGDIPTAWAPAQAT